MNKKRKLIEKYIIILLLIDQKDQKRFQDLLNDIIPTMEKPQQKFSKSYKWNI